jgi:hypothetical protein
MLFGMKVYFRKLLVNSLAKKNNKQTIFNEFIHFETSDINWKVYSTENLFDVFIIYIILKG